MVNLLDVHFVRPCMRGCAPAYFHSQKVRAICREQLQTQRGRLVFYLAFALTFSICLFATLALKRGEDQRMTV